VLKSDFIDRKQWYEIGSIFRDLGIASLGGAVAILVISPISWWSSWSYWASLIIGAILLLIGLKLKDSNE